MTDEYKDDDQAADDACTAEFLRMILADRLDLYDAEVHPPTATSEARLTFNDDVYQGLEERAARSDMTVEELVHTALGTGLGLRTQRPTRRRRPGEHAMRIVITWSPNDAERDQRESAVV